jgi:hypothetical protein
MDLSEFAANYAHFGDDELLCLWADRNTLVPEAVIALDSELQRRGLKKQNATRVTTTSYGLSLSFNGKRM